MPKPEKKTEEPAPETPEDLDIELFGQDDDEGEQDQDSTPPGGETTGEGTKGTDDKAPRWRDDIYRRQSKLEQDLRSENQRLQQSMTEMKGMFQGFLASQEKGAEVPTKGTATPELDPATEQQYWEQKPGEVARYLINQKIAKERSALKQEVLQEVRSENQTATTMRRIYHDFPELRNDYHPFTQKANELYNELAGEFGGAAAIPDGSQSQLMLIQMAAERAARVHGDLRDEEEKSQRRGRGNRMTQNATGGGITLGRPGSSKRKAATPELTQEDYDIAKRWKVNLQNPDVAKRIVVNKKEEQAKRLAPKYVEEEPE
jgi:hypothetical protein